MRYSVLIATALTVSVAHAAQDSADLARSIFQQEVKQSGAYQPTATDGTSAVRESAGSTGTPITSNTGNSINPGAAAGKKSQDNGAAINMAAGAAMLAACMATQPPNMALCAMGAMALAQGGHDSGASGQSAATYNASQLNGTTTPTTTTATGKPTYADPSKGTSGFSNPAVAKGLAALKENGYTVTDAGVKLPNGSFQPASSMGTSAMASNFGADAVREAQKVTAAVNDEINRLGANVAGVAVDSSGGGGADGGSTGGEASESGSAGLGTHSYDPNARKRLMAGKTVNFDGEPIGVRGNNIFDMVHECYQKKRAGNHFIEGVSNSTANRLPASVGRPKK
ncbi:MAG: hypothetical protein KF799_01715 [Bdellovibrionales bacterium]|nr:hypothetical protein [Bdellovibrionales bacterium]